MGWWIAVLIVVFIIGTVLEIQEQRFIKKLYPIRKEYKKVEDSYLTIYDYLERHNKELYHEALEREYITNKLDTKRSDAIEEENKRKELSKTKEQRMEEFRKDCEGKRKFMREHPGCKI